MVGTAKSQSGYTNTYNIVESKDERECSSGVRKCPPSTNPSGNYSGLWTERKDYKETYDVILANGQTVTKTYWSFLEGSEIELREITYFWCGPSEIW